MNYHQDIIEQKIEQLFVCSFHKCYQQDNFLCVENWTLISWKKNKKRHSTNVSQIF